MIILVFVKKLGYDSWLALVPTPNDIVLISPNSAKNLIKIRAEIWTAKAWVTCSILEFRGIKLASFYIIYAGTEALPNKAYLYTKKCAAWWDLVLDQRGDAARWGLVKG